ncbi:MAG: CinA family protein [Lachnospiraceae bacterium]|nr:CinA family protein [Lachnospiraceae bacterium]
MRENFIGIPTVVCNEKAVREHYRNLTLKLIEKGLTITTMESATAGQIASLITDTEGSSAVLRGAFVTYSNEAKVLQGVPYETIFKHSVYSEETAKSMAMACKATYGADIGIGVTGTMGNVDPENEKNSVPGEVYFAIIMGDEIHSFIKKIPHQPTRLLYKLFVADLIYMELDKILN